MGGARGGASDPNRHKKSCTRCSESFVRRLSVTIMPAAAMAERMAVMWGEASGDRMASVVSTVDRLGKISWVSRATDSSLSEPWHAFWRPFVPNFARRLCGNFNFAAAESVGPMRDLQAWMAHGRARTRARAGPEVMKATRGSKKLLGLVLSVELLRLTTSEHIEYLGGDDSEARGFSLCNDGVSRFEGVWLNPCKRLHGL